MDGHLKGLEEFFDRYRASMEKWRRRNEGYYRTICTIHSEPVSKKKIPIERQVEEEAHCGKICLSASVPAAVVA